MKHTIAETNINKSNRSLISTIPNTIVSLETLTNSDSIRWSYEIKDNKHIYYVEFIKDGENKPDENSEKTSSDIDMTTEKQEKNNHSTESSTEHSSDNNNVTNHSTNETSKQNKKNMNILDESRKTTKIKTLHEPDDTDETEKEQYKKLVKEDKNSSPNNDGTFIIAIQTNQRKTKTTYKLNFKLQENKKKTFTNITYDDGSLQTSFNILQELRNKNKDEIIDFIRTHTKDNNKEKLEQKLKENNLI